MPGKNKILLIYPQMGFSGTLVRHMPLSLLYAAVDSLTTGFEVEIVDVRLCPEKWKEELTIRITQETVLAGISVMTGSPIRSALEISCWLKLKFPHVRIVWGGPHATFAGDNIIRHESVDYVIRGYGSLPLARLAATLLGDADSLSLEDIPGLDFRRINESAVISVPPEHVFERFDYRSIPYHLIEKNLQHYGQLGTDERIFPLHSSMGCPYRCAFCSSPAQYREMQCRYEMYPPSDVADHIEYVHTRYGASYIYFIDDDSFVDLDHVEKIIDEVKRRGILVKLGFRGARVSEIIRMDERYLSKLAAAGTTILHIGAESGSQRMLDLMKKDCTVEDILEANRLLARQPGITAAYNWIVVMPGETVEELRETRELVLRILADNPSAIIFPPNKYRPLPGTELYETAVRFGYRIPQKLEDWIDVEVEGSYCAPWYSEKFAQMIHMMQVTSYFIDNKLKKIETGNTARFLMVRVLGWIYRPVALFRYRFGLPSALIEYWLFTRIARHFGK